MEYNRIKQILEELKFKKTIYLFKLSKTNNTVLIQTKNDKIWNLTIDDYKAIDEDQLLIKIIELIN